MITRLISIFLALACGISVYAGNEMYGTWSGKLNVQGHSLRLVFHIEEPEGGAGLPIITMDSPDQGATGLAVQTDYCSADSIAISAPAMRMTYTGSRKNDTITGTFSQMGLRLPLELQKGDNAPSRPQTPQPPFPYPTKDLKFKSIADTVTLGATLTLPENANLDTPVIVMVSGSGQQNRDEELYSHKPFAVIADRLARAGIGSLRYDDRGVGESTGNPVSDITADFVLDAEGALRMLREAGYKKIGVLGHSEGGSIAFMTAHSEYSPDFLVTLGAPAAIGKDILLDQIISKIADMGLKDAELEGIRNVLAQVFDTIVENPSASKTELQTLIRENMDKNIPLLTSPTGMDRLIMENLKKDMSMYEIPWMRAFLAYDPANDIRNTNKPTFALYGAKDTQVRPSMNVPLMQEYNGNITIKVYDNLNHLMQPCQTGKPTEYGDIEMTIDETVIADIINFIQAL